jgi:hypothetical protein
LVWPCRWKSRDLYDYLATFDALTLSPWYLPQILACINAEFNVEQGETGNFWEPLHYIIYGTGVQNFEWSKEYAM